MSKLTEDYISSMYSLLHVNYTLIKLFKMIQNKKSLSNSVWKIGFATLHSPQILALWRPVLLSESNDSDQ